MAKKKKQEETVIPEAMNWWKVPVKCYGVFADAISICVPSWDKKRYQNRIWMYPKKDMPKELLDVVYNGMEFEAEVPMICHTQAEFRVRNVVVPKSVVK